MKSYIIGCVFSRLIVIYGKLCLLDQIKDYISVILWKVLPSSLCRRPSYVDIVPNEAHGVKTDQSEPNKTKIECNRVKMKYGWQNWEDFRENLEDGQRILPLGLRNMCHGPKEATRRPCPNIEVYRSNKREVWPSTNPIHLLDLSWT